MYIHIYEQFFTLTALYYALDRMFRQYVLGRIVGFAKKVEIDATFSIV